MATFVFHDFETQSNSDLPIVGTMAYVLDESTRPLLWSWAVDDEPVYLWCPDLSAELDPEVWAYVRGRMRVVGGGPPEMHELFARPDTYAVAHNSGFDRAVWQQIATPEFGFPKIAIEQTLDSMAQIQASNLPGKLDWAGRMLGLGTKTIGGNAIMKRFADRHLPLPGSPEDLGDDPRGRPARVQAAITIWALYLDYSEQDTLLLRDVWRCTRPLDQEEWREYWSFEHINDKGMMVDLEVCRGAVEYREEEGEYVEAECARLTDGAILKPTLTQQINQWLYAQLPEDLGSLMVKERDENGAVVKLTAAKQTLTRLLEDINDSDTPPPDNVVEFIELLQFGRSSSAIKFQKLLNQSVDERLCGSYVFNGAGQTGRGSSRGAQVHNLPRDVVPDELKVLDMIVARVPISELRALPLTKADIKKSNRPPTSVNALLARLIRPTFIAPENKVLVWGDWAAIEARVTPWLANTRAAEEAVLTPFRTSDADDSVPDVYVQNAADVFRMQADEVWTRYKEDDPDANSIRQSGKVMVLGLQFLGGVGALRAMARNYRIAVSNEEAQRWVDVWRDRNRWARKFGDKCEEAAFHAMNAPLDVFAAGRLRYQFLPDLMGGSLAAFLPDSRPLLYPIAEIKKIERFGKERDTITYLNGMGRRSLWNGLQVENCLAGDTQVLTRRGIVRLDSVQGTDLLWDGIEWVAHSKLLAKGAQPTIDKWGVAMTPDHLVKTDDGWKKAEDCSRSDRADVWLPDDAPAFGSFGRARTKSLVAGPVRLWDRVRGAYRWLQKQSKTLAYKLWVQNEGIAGSVPPLPRYVGSSGLLGVAFNGRSLHPTKPSGLEELRWARDSGLLPVAAIVRDLLDRHEGGLSTRASDRTREQREGLRAGQLPVGDPTRADAEYAGQPDDRYAEGTDAGSRSIGDKRHRDNDAALPAGSRLDDSGAVPAPGLRQSVQVVYDLLDCGPRNRFTVFDNEGAPFLVHNCTQGAAASILRGTLVRLEERFPDTIIGHTHDEVIGEVPEATTSVFAEQLEHVMVEGFPWTEGLPLAAEVKTDFYYHK